MIFVDAKNIECPEPVTMCKRELRWLSDGDEVSVEVNSPTCAKSLERMCLMLDHTHVSTIWVDDVATIIVKKGLEG